MRRALSLATLVLAFACARVPPAELARTTPYRLAREHGAYVTLPDGLHVFAITLGSGRDVVLLHGNPASTYSWRKVIEPLATRYRVHAIDFPGYGFSDKPAGAPYDAPWLAGRLLAYLDAQHVGRAVVVGNSMGGYVASELAIGRPERVSALVLVDASGLPEGEPMRPLSYRILAWPVVGPLLRALPARGRVRTRLRENVHDPTQITEADVDAYYAPLRSAGGTNAFVARLGQTLPADRADRVHRIRAPTLVVTGDADPVVPPVAARRYHELIPGSELVVIEQTGHIPQEERPERTVAEIIRFVEAHP